jgi:hypothetical protein
MRYNLIKYCRVFKYGASISLTNNLKQSTINHFQTAPLRAHTVNILYPISCNSDLLLPLLHFTGISINQRLQWAI